MRGQRYQQLRSQLQMKLFLQNPSIPVDCTDEIKPQPFQNPLLDFHSQFTTGRKIGEGAHGVVRLCWRKELETDQMVVKILKVADLEIRKGAMDAFKLTTGLNHPNLIVEKWLYDDRKNSKIYLVSEYFKSRNLQQILHGNNGEITKQLCQKIIYCLLQALQYCHSQGLCHRDVKPDNILVNESNEEIKLIDFGVCQTFRIRSRTYLVEESEMWTPTGNLHYQAPDMIEGGYDQAVDIWSLGVVAYQCLVGSLPFVSESPSELVRAITDESQCEYLNHPKFLELGRVEKDFIQRVLQKNPSKRLSADDALDHPWMLEMRNKNELSQVHQDDSFIKSNSSASYRYSKDDTLQTSKENDSHIDLQSLKSSFRSFQNIFINEDLSSESKIKSFHQI